MKYLSLVFLIVLLSNCNSDKNFDIRVKRTIKTIGSDKFEIEHDSIYIWEKDEIEISLHMIKDKGQITQISGEYKPTGKYIWNTIIGREGNAMVFDCKLDFLIYMDKCGYECIEQIKKTGILCGDEINILKDWQFYPNMEKYKKKKSNKIAFSQFLFKRKK